MLPLQKADLLWSKVARLAGEEWSDDERNQGVSPD